jgi:hypothetical protein
VGDQALEPRIIGRRIGEVVGVVEIGVVDVEQATEGGEAGVHRLTAQADDPRLRQGPVDESGVDKVQGRRVHDALMPGRKRANRAQIGLSDLARVEPARRLQRHLIQPRRPAQPGHLREDPSEVRQMASRGGVAVPQEQLHDL